MAGSPKKLKKPRWSDNTFAIMLAGFCTAGTLIWLLIWQYYSLLGLGVTVGISVLVTAAVAWLLDVAT